MFSVLAIKVIPGRAFVMSSSAIRDSSMFYFTSSIKSEPVLPHPVYEIMQRVRISFWESYRRASLNAYLGEFGFSV